MEGSPNAVNTATGLTAGMKTMPCGTITEIIIRLCASVVHLVVTVKLLVNQVFTVQLVHIHLRAVLIIDASQVAILQKAGLEAIWMGNFINNATWATIIQIQTLLTLSQIPQPQRHDIRTDIASALITTRVMQTNIALQSTNALKGHDYQPMHQHRHRPTGLLLLGLHIKFIGVTRMETTTWMLTAALTV